MNYEEHEYEKILWALFYASKCNSSRHPKPFLLVNLQTWKSIWHWKIIKKSFCAPPGYNFSSPFARLINERANKGFTLGAREKLLLMQIAKRRHRATSISEQSKKITSIYTELCFPQQLNPRLISSSEHDEQWRNYILLETFFYFLFFSSLVRVVHQLGVV